MKIGDSVIINNPHDILHGKIGTIINIRGDKVTYKIRLSSNRVTHIHKKYLIPQNKNGNI